MPHRTALWVALAAAIVGALALTVSLRASQPHEPSAGRLLVGAYVHLKDRPFKDPVAPEDLAALEARIGPLDLVHYYLTWGRQFEEVRTPNLDEHEVMLSMKPNGDLVQRIVAGDQDDYIDEFASDVRDFDRPVHIRFGHEMNGHWMTYSAGNPHGPSAKQFVAAWRRVVDRFRAEGADNAVFVWSPNEDDFPARDGNRMEDYWPGEDYVDIAGFDGYDWASTKPQRGDGKDRSFEEVVRGPYERLTRLTDKPIWVCETGTTDPGKAEWIRDMFATTAFPRVTAIVYFSEDEQRDVQRDWRIDSSDESAAAWRAGVAAHRAEAAAAERAADRATSDDVDRTP